MRAELIMAKRSQARRERTKPRISWIKERLAFLDSYGVPYLPNQADSYVRALERCVKEREELEAELKQLLLV